MIHRKKAADANIDSEKTRNSNDVWNTLTNFLLIFLLILLIITAFIRPSPGEEFYPDELLEKARRYRNHGQFQNSMDVFERYLELFRDEPDGYIEYAQLLLENGFLDESSEILSQLNVPVLNPRLRSEYHLLRGRIHDRNDNLLAALTDYRIAHNLNEFNILNGLMLIITNIRIPNQSADIKNEFVSVMEHLERLTDDQTVFSFIRACQAFEASDYLDALKLYKESASSEILFIRYESFRQMMNITKKTEADPSTMFYNMEKIINMAKDLDSSRLLEFSLEEIYAVSIFEYAFNNDELSGEKRAEKLRESQNLLHNLFINGVATPNVYLCYAAILGDHGNYRYASEVLNRAEQVIGDNILILIHQVYTEVGLQNRYGTSDFDNIRDLNDRVERLFSEEPDHMTEMMEYREFIRNMSRMGLL